MHTLLGLYVSASGMTAPFSEGADCFLALFIYKERPMWQKGVFMGHLNVIGWVFSELMEGTSAMRVLFWASPLQSVLGMVPTSRRSFTKSGRGAISHGI